MPLLNKPQSPKPVSRKPLTPTERREFAEVNAQKTVVMRWPEIRRPEGLGLSVADGFYFGVGLWLAFIFLGGLTACMAGIIISIVQA